MRQVVDYLYKKMLCFGLDLLNKFIVYLKLEVTRSDNAATNCEYKQCGKKTIPLEVCTIS